MTTSVEPRAEAGRPHLLLISTGVRLFREYLLAPIAQRYRIHLFVEATPRWERKYVDAVTVLADASDAEPMIRAARELHRRNPVQGVLCWDEGRVIAAAQVAEALGLPGGDPAVVRRCRDKHQTRERMASAGVAQPRSVLVETAEQAAAAAHTIGYPVVLKPRAMEASLGVVLVRDETELLSRFGFARSQQMSDGPPEPGAVLVEEYAEGPEISVDCAVFQGEVFPICVARKEVGYPPYFEEVGSTGSGHPDQVQLGRRLRPRHHRDRLSHRHPDRLCQGFPSIPRP
jgi:biotin carboxylase